MRLQLTESELKQFLPTEPGLLAHCRRVAALSAEIALRLLLAPQERTILEQAALLHHSSLLSPSPAPERLLADLGLATFSKDRHPPSSEAAAKLVPDAPAVLVQVLAELNGRPVAGPHPDRTRLLARIIETCNLFDEQIEWLPAESRPVAEIVAGLRELTTGGLLDDVPTAALSDLTTRFHAHLARLPARLPPSARAAHEILTALGGHEIEVADLERLATQDPILTAALIQAANSALYARSAPAKTVREAIAFLGINAARRVLLATALRPWMRSAGLEETWRHCVSTGLWCHKMAAATGIADAEEAMLTGLVHDLGRVAMQYLPADVTTVFSRLQKGGCPPTYVEILLLGSDHGQVGASILTGWSFPHSIVQAVRWHHQPEQSPEELAALLYLAEFWECSEEDLPSSIRLLEALEKTGLTLDRLRTLDAQRQPEDVLSAVLAA